MAQRENVQGSLEVRTNAETQGAAQGQDATDVVRSVTRLSGLATAGPINRRSAWSSAYGLQGLFDAVSRLESVGVSVADTRSTNEAMFLRESLTRSQTVNVSNGLTKFDHSTITLAQQFLQRSVGKFVIDPTFTSKQLRAQAHVNKPQ